MHSKLCVYVLLVISCHLARPQYLTTRVVGGSPTSVQLYPIVAQLLLDSWGAQQYAQHCAGVILTARHLVSTAHCYQHNTQTNTNYTLPKYWKVRVGSSYRSGGGVIHSVKSIIPHKEFDPYFYSNDIAVVVVRRKFTFNSYVGQATIAKSRSEVREGSFCTLVGWGSAETSGPQSEQLQQTMMYTIDNEVCRARYNTIGAAVMPSMLCAGKLDMGGADGCYGDSGGPLIYKGVVIGLVSFGYDCGHPYYPGVYTKISHFTDWIVNVINNNK
ncbi:trypsin, alkaline A-like [Pectinophora gossypiella]|uniref:trypsin, alkaline A-like n=1 Tax=Pectinophora gossypiella TaxID=13191 RepID=UPI00214E78F0|nr:trypsin, alkaline A-like [Pectinophora gossypiella]